MLLSSYPLQLSLKEQAALKRGDVHNREDLRKQTKKYCKGRSCLGRRADGKDSPPASQTRVSSCLRDVASWQLRPHESGAQLASLAGLPSQQRPLTCPLCSRAARGRRATFSFPTMSDSSPSAAGLPLRERSAPRHSHPGSARHLLSPGLA